MTIIRSVKSISANLHIDSVKIILKSNFVGTEYSRIIIFLVQVLHFNLTIKLFFNVIYSLYEISMCRGIKLLDHSFSYECRKRRVMN
jgi:hypothetical protein